MTDLFQYQGFGVLSEWNGQVRSPSAQLAMQDIAATNANSIEITPRIWTSTASSNTVLSDPAKTESDASLIQGIANAHADGLKVILKPNISTLDGKGSSALAPSDVGAFFASYKAEVVHLAAIAQQTGTEMLAIGNEMSSLSGSQYKAYWTDIISSVRAVYSGEVTYAAATDEASKVSFWGQLDTIGVNTYPPLTVPGTPTVTDIVNAWQQVPSNPYWAAAFNHLSPVDFLHSMAEQYNKPVLMTEAGYRSIDYGTTITGSWQTSGAMALQEQASAYEAFLQAWSTQGGPWLKGVEFWQWDMNEKFSPTGFSPMGKPAEAIVAEYFKGAAPLLAGGIESLTDGQIAQIAALGVDTIVATDHTVKLSVSQAAALAAAHISLSQPYGSGAQSLTWNADGSLHDIHFYAIKDNTYSDYDVVYNAAGKPLSASHSTGLTETWSYNPDGSLHEFIQNNIIGKPWTTTDTLYGASGKPAAESWHNGATLVQTENWNSDGSVHDIHYFAVTGHTYTDYAVYYGANNKPAFASYSDGMTESWTYNADNSLHSISYQGVTGTSYSAYTSGYGADRQNVVQTFAGVDGTQTVRGFADHLTFTVSANGESVTTSQGDVFNFAANAHTTLTGGGADDTFVFHQGFGQATITNFVPDPQTGAAHDTIAFAPGTFANYADLMSHTTQSGTSTVITDTAGDHLVLKNVDMAHLAPSDFYLV